MDPARIFPHDLAAVNRDWQMDLMYNVRVRYRQLSTL